MRLTALKNLSFAGHRRWAAILVAMAAGYGIAQFAAHAGAPTWWPDRDRDRNVRYFRAVLQQVKENYVDEAAANYDELTRSALAGMVNHLDPHSEFQLADDFEETEDELSNAFTGVGIQVEMRDGQVTVIIPIAGSPAERAGILRGDRLIKIDGKPIEEPSIEKTVKLVRGAPDSTVTLTMQRTGVNHPLDFTLKRERIELESVRNATRLPSGVGYVQITQFSERTGDEFGKALEGLEKQGISSLVIDLRNNPGGLLDAAIDVCDEFFDKDELVVYTQGRTPDSRENFRADGEHPPRHYPIALLVNGSTASAAEIVSGAMRDTRRAVIVGEKTFGKGSVQTIFKLQNGEGMRLTTARYFTPSGVTIHGKGIAPQVEVELSPEDEAKLRLQESRPDLTGSAEFNVRFGFQRIDDPQLDAAVEVLTGVLAARGPAT